MSPNLTLLYKVLLPQPSSFLGWAWGFGLALGLGLGLVLDWALGLDWA